MSRYLYLVALVPAAAALAWLVRAWEPRLTERTGPAWRERLLVALVVLLGVVVVYGPFLLGGARFAYRDAGLDTADLYVPFYVDLVDSVREGSLGAWNFDYGLGASVASYQSWILDPFNLALVPLGLALGTERLSLVLVLVQALRLLCSALLFDCLLARYCETPLARALGSVCYAFCGFALLWGQHYWLGGACPLLALVLLALERLRESWSAPRFAAVAAVTALCVGWSPYVGLMVMLPAAVYMLLRLVHFARGPHPALSVARGTLRLLAPVACGCLVGCLTLVPYALYLTGETARVSAGPEASLLARAGSFLTEFVPASWLPMVLSRLLGDGLVTSGGALPEAIVPATASFPYVNAYEFVTLGFGCLSLVLLGQFAHWALVEASRRDRALVAVAAALVVLYCTNSFLPALLNALTAPKYRSAFALAVPVCLAMAVGWERRLQARRPARGALLASAVASAAVLAWSLANTVDGAALCVASLAILAAATALALRLPCARRPSAVVLSLCALAVAAPLADGLFVTCNRVTCTEADFPGSADPHDADTEAALAWVRAQDGSLYRVAKTYEDWCRYNDALVQGYMGVSSYNSTGDSDVAAYFGALWPEVVGSDGATQYFPDASEPLELASDLGVRYLLSRERQGEPYELVATFGDVGVWRCEGASLVRGSASVVPESALREMSGPEERRRALEAAVAVPDDVAGELAAGLSGGEAPVEADLRRERADALAGTLVAGADAVARLSVPYTQGWHVRIDGEEVDTFRADLGFLGFVVPAGDHEVEVTYELPGLGLGAGLAAAGALATVAGAAAGRALARRRQSASIS